MSSINYNPENFDVETVECQLCGNEYERTLNGHLSRTHGMSAPEYREIVGEDAPIVTREQVYKMHNKVMNPYWDDTNTFWQDLRGTLDFDVAPEMTDTYQSVTCRVCGEDFRNLSKHIPTHDIRIETYQDLFPNAPLVADSLSDTVGRPRKQIGSYDWRNDLPWGDNSIMANQEFFEEIESREWFDSGTYEKAMELLDDHVTSSRGHDMKSILLGALYYAANIGTELVTPESVSSVSNDVEERVMLNKALNFGSSMNQPGDVLNSIEVSDKVDQKVRDYINNDVPSTYVGSRNPRIVVGVAMYNTTPKTQQECADLVDANVESIRQAKDKLKDW